jgi:hypothetical protein
MFVHSLWSETAAPLALLAERASQLLGVAATVSEYSAELPVIGQADEPAIADERWGSRANAPRGLEPVRLYAAGAASGIASVNPSLNFWLRDQLSEYEPSRPLRLGWKRYSPYQLIDWQVSAIHLQHQSASTEVIIQGQRDSADPLFDAAERFPDYEVAGVSLADEGGRVLTLYDEGQLWLQQVAPDEVHDLLMTVVLPLLGRG